MMVAGCSLFGCWFWGIEIKFERMRIIGYYVMYLHVHVPTNHLAIIYKTPPGSYGGEGGVGW